MNQNKKRIRVSDVLAKKGSGKKITMLTAYDATMARLLDRSGVDMLLVGDSLGTVILGYETTLPVTIEAMIHHSRAVSNGAERALVVADMPFLTYQASVTEAVHNAGRLLQEGGAAAVKLEGGLPVVDTVRRLVDIGIPVMGHLGLTPQSVHLLGGYRTVGKIQEEADAIMAGAQALEQAGAFALVLELVPYRVAEAVTAELKIPTIGIGAGPACDGQVLVSYDAFRYVRASVREAIRQTRRSAHGSRPGICCRSGARTISGTRTHRLRLWARAMKPRLIPLIKDLGDAMADLKRANRTVGFVPTMGALHAGHGALIDRAKRECDAAVVSVFVNPTQFNQRDDYDRYPRDLETDFEFCKGRQVEIVFAPDAEEMYPQPGHTIVEVNGVSDGLCGEFRPGHFRGVATVVLKLLNIVQPDKAYFGEKDAQQLAVISRMVTDLNFPVQIVGVPTVREPDGLAMSSRNACLHPEERRVAPVLYHALEAVEKEIAAGCSDPGKAKQAGLTILRTEPRIRPEYFEIVDPDEMSPVARIAGPVRIVAAVWLGSTRLIDNLLAAPGC